MVSEASADAAGCCCTAHLYPDWETRGRERRNELFRSGPSDGFLLYRDGTPVAWCQCAPTSIGFRMKFPTGDDWAMTCMLVRPEFRRRGLGAEFVRLLLDELPRRGCRRVYVVGHRPEAYDDPGTFMELPAAVCERLGLDLVRDDPVCPLYARSYVPDMREDG